MHRGKLTSDIVIVQYADWAPLTAFTAALFVVWWLTRGYLSRFGLDHPNARSLHQVPTPRTGGIGIHVGIVLAAAIIAPGLPLSFWAAYAALCVISMIDDMRGVPVGPRLAAHVLAAAAVVTATPFAREAYAAILVVLAIAWMTNLYNFMDGSDGLAGGMTLFGFSFYAGAAWMSGDNAFALLAASIAAAALAFLFFNFPPARIFLGDIGSVPLGFLAGALGFNGWLRGVWPWWFPLLVFSPFIVDASVTLAARLLRRERVWQAHRDHCYQRLVRLGWGHRRTALAEYGLMFACGTCGLLILNEGATVQAVVLVSIGVVYAALLMLTTRAWRRHEAPAA